MKKTILFFGMIFLFALFSYGQGFRIDTTITTNSGISITNTAFVSWEISTNLGRTYTANSNIGFLVKSWVTVSAANAGKEPIIFTNSDGKYLGNETIIVTEQQFNDMLDPTKSQSVICHDLLKTYLAEFFGITVSKIIDL